MTTQNPHHERRWLILGLLGLAQLMVVLDATIVNIALPSAQESLGFSDANRQWIITAYALAFGSLLLLGGRLSDLLGRKRVLITGLIGFAVSSAIGGAAQSFEVLVAARAAQGIFAALLAPAALSLLTTTFTDEKERNKAFGVYGAIAGTGGGIGLLMGGVLTEYLSWRWTMYVNLAFAVPAALGALSLLHNQIAERRPQLDVPGTLTATGGLFALVYGFASAESDGWGAPVTVAMFVVAAVLLTAFVLIERRVAHPLLPLRVVLDRARGGAYVAMAIAGIGMFGVFLFLTYYLQTTLGFTPVQTGLAFLPMMGAVMLTATTATAVLLSRVGARPLVTLGMLLAAGAMVFLTGVGVDTAYASHVLPSLLAMGVGMGLIFAPAMNTATLGVDAGDAGVASAMVNTAQQVGGSIGTALLSTVAATAAANAANGSQDPLVLAEAAVHSYTTAFWWSAGVFALGAVIAFTVLPGGKRTAREIEEDAERLGEPVLAH